MAKRMAKKNRKSKRPAMKLQNLCQTGTTMGGVAANSFQDYYINAAHIMSMMNRKAFHQVHSDGRIINYGLQIQVFNCVNALTRIFTASQGYPMENAVRAWHFARKERYEDAGFKLSDLGYGSRLRFAIDKDMSDKNQSTDAYMIGPSHLADTVDSKGEWDFSDVIINPPGNPDKALFGVEVDDLYDSFVLHLTGDHTLDAAHTGLETIKYSHVGMIQSWTENTRGWATPSADEVIQPENPLAFARASSFSSLLLTTEVADEQKQSPPYSNVDDDTATSVFAQPVLQGLVETGFPNPTTNDDLITVPGGVAKIRVENNSDAAAYPFMSVRIFQL